MSKSILRQMLPVQMALGKMDCVHASDNDHEQLAVHRALASHQYSRSCKAITPKNKHHLERSFCCVTEWMYGVILQVIHLGRPTAELKKHIWSIGPIVINRKVCIPLGRLKCVCSVLIYSPGHLIGGLCVCVRERERERFKLASSQLQMNRVMTFFQNLIVDPPTPLCNIW